VEDRDIIKLYFDRDERAVELTLKKYGSYCKSIAENILNGGEVAENCVKKALRQAWDSIPPQLPIVFPAFLGKLVRKISFEKYRRRENSVSDGLRKIRTSLSEYLLKKGIEPCGKEQFYRLFCDIDDTAVETASVTPEKNHPVRRLIISTAAALLVGLLIAAAVFFVNSMK
jgi:hypothetical protein